MQITYTLEVEKTGVKTSHTMEYAPHVESVGLLSIYVVASYNSYIVHIDEKRVLRVDFTITWNAEDAITQAIDSLIVKEKSVMQTRMETLWSVSSLLIMRLDNMRDYMPAPMIARYENILLMNLEEINNIELKFNS
jgi:hypothetical protein